MLLRVEYSKLSLLAQAAKVSGYTVDFPVYRIGRHTYIINMNGASVELNRLYRTLKINAPIRASFRYFVIARDGKDSIIRIPGHIELDIFNSDFPIRKETVSSQAPAGTLIKDLFPRLCGPQVILLREATVILSGSEIGLQFVEDGQRYGLYLNLELMPFKVKPSRKLLRKIYKIVKQGNYRQITEYSTLQTPLPYGFYCELLDTPAIRLEPEARLNDAFELDNGTIKLFGKPLFALIRRQRS